MTSVQNGLSDNHHHAHPYTPGFSGIADPYAAGDQRDPNPTPAHALGTNTQGQNPNLKHAHSLKRRGKIENTIGKILRSHSLRQKGESKIEKANAIEVQHGELIEAQRLEQEAMLRRERANAHGEVIGSNNNNNGPMRGVFNQPIPQQTVTASGEPSTGADASFRY